MLSRPLPFELLADDFAGCSLVDFGLCFLGGTVGTFLAVGGLSSPSGPADFVGADAAPVRVFAGTSADGAGELLFNPAASVSPVGGIGVSSDDAAAAVFTDWAPISDAG